MTKKEKAERAQLEKDKLNLEHAKRIMKLAISIAEGTIKENEIKINKKYERKTINALANGKGSK